MTHFILATAGHVDHGKSALVKALTGTDPDRLPEEKRRSITIDLGFAELLLKTEGDRELSVGIVDVPGHEDFVRNMIAGVGSIDVGLLIVAADDGWMPQTEEHFEILDYLGVRRLVVAITKCDATDGEAATSEVRAQLKDSPFANAAIVQTSAHSGRGLDNLKAALRKTLVAVPAPPDYGKPRLPIDRVFTLRGIGTVVTGTLTGGNLKPGDTIWLQPAGIQTRIRSMESHSRDLSLAHPGMRTALSLPEIATGDSPKAAKRGDMVCANSAAPTQTIDVLLQISGRHAVGARAITTNMKVDLHHGTTRIRSSIKLLERDSLGRGGAGLAQLRLEQPIIAFFQDRFVVRDTAQKQTLAGGIVLDPEASRRRDRRDGQLVFLRTRAKQPESIEVALLTQLQRDQFVATAGLLQKSPFSAEQVAEASRQLATEQRIILASSLAADVSAWRTLREHTIELIDQTHAENPQKPGLELSGLRSKLRAYPADVLDAVVADLAAGDFIRKGEVIARRSHRAELPASLQPEAAEILRQLSEKPFDPPAMKQIIADRAAHDALNFLIKSGSVTQISPDVIMRSEDFENAKTMVANFIRQRGPATVSALRQELQSSRRVLVPFLERLDRQGFTRRIGDQRVLSAI